MENTVKFILGEETQPIIESGKELESSIFKFEITKAIDIINDRLEKLEETKRDIEEEWKKDIILNNHSNNIISFIGERGAGKTSCMYSVLESIKNNEKIEILKPLDPSFFDDYHNILEIVIGELYHKSINYIKKNTNIISGKYDAHNLMKKFQDVKRDIRYLDKNTRFENDDELEELEYLSAGVNLERIIEDLIDSYLKLLKKKILIISIDDIDLNTSQAYGMAEQIRKYLILPNIIILLAVKIDQLANVIESNLVEEFKRLLDKEMIAKDSISEMSEKYLNKLLPINQRIYLPNTEVLFDKKLIITKESKENTSEKIDKNQSNNDTIKIIIPKLIFDKCNYLFYNSRGVASEIIPRNLRELRLFLSLLYNMKDPIDVEIQNLNRNIFKNYLFTVWIEQLGQKEITIARELIKETEPTLFNKKVITLLKDIHDFSKLPHDTENIFGIVDIQDITNENNVAYNISLGDVLYVINQIEAIVTNTSVRRLLFFIKTLYTIKLSEYFPQIKDKSNLSNDSPTKKDILENVSDYEKLVGGNYFHLEGDTILDNEERKIGREIRLVDGKKLFQYIDEIEKKYERNNNQLDQETKSKLNAVEYFILTISRFVKTKNKSINEASYQKYRLQFTPYYERSFSNTTKNLMFDFLSPFFTVIDLDRTYERFSEKLLQITQKTDGSLYNSIKEKTFIPELLQQNIEIIDDIFLYLKQQRGEIRKGEISEIFKEIYYHLSEYKIRTYKNEEPISLDSFQMFSNLFKTGSNIIEYFKDVYTRKDIDSIMNFYFKDLLNSYSDKGETKNTISSKISNILEDLSEDEIKLYFKNPSGNKKWKKNELKDILREIIIENDIDIPESGENNEQANIENTSNEPKIVENTSDDVENNAQTNMKNTNNESVIDENSSDGVENNAQINIEDINNNETI